LHIPDLTLTLVEFVNNEINTKEKYSLEIDKQINLRKKEIFYNYLKQWSAGALKPKKTILTIIYVLSIDFQQNMPLS